MKKSLIALAVLAASGAAMAQSSVTLFGTVDPSVQNQKTTFADGTKRTQSLLGNDGRGTSQLSIKGVEDIGGGLKAIFLYEGDFHIGSQAGTTATTAGGGVSGLHSVGSRGGEIYGGLTGSFGSIKLGTPNTPTLNTQASRQPIGTKIGGGFASTLGVAHVRNDGSLVYASPNMGGVTVSFGYAFKGKGGTNTAATSPAGTVPSPADSVAGIPLTADLGSKTDLAADFAQGPIKAGLSLYSQTKTGAQTDNNKQTNLYAQYAIAGSTAYFGYHSEKGFTGAKSSGMNVAGKILLAPSLYAIVNISKLDDKSTADRDRTVNAFGGEYQLSARTTVYARYVTDKTKNIAASTNSGTVAGSNPVKDQNTVLLGVQHNF